MTNEGAHGGDFFIYRVIKGRDGKIYILGTGDGANQFFRSPFVSSANATVNVPNTSFDTFTQVNVFFIIFLFFLFLFFYYFFILFFIFLFLFFTNIFIYLLKIRV